MSFTPISEALEENIGTKGPLQKQVDASRVLEFTQEILNELLGEELGVHAKPLFLKNRTLTITCASSAVAQEVRLNQNQIVEKINDKLGKKEVDRIRYLA